MVSDEWLLFGVSVLSASIAGAVSWFVTLRSEEGKFIKIMESRSQERRRSSVHHWRRNGALVRTRQSLTESTNRLDSRSLVDLNLPPCENALRLLHHLQDKVKSDSEEYHIFNYIGGTIGMDHSKSSMPQLLHETLRGEDNIIDDQARRHLCHYYAGIGAHELAPRKHRTLKSVAGAVKFMVRLLNSVEHETVPFLPYPAEQHEQDRIVEALERLSEWDFDVFEFNRVTSGRPLQTLGWTLLHHYGLCRRFGIEWGTLKKFLAHVESHYATKNPYHNAIHAADVLQSVHCLLHTCGLARHLVEVDVLALLLGAMVHDVGHDGVSNEFHKLSLTQIALRHNNRSVLENHHLSSIFMDMQEDPGIDILHLMQPEVARSLRETLITLILGTDMSAHFINLKDLTTISQELHSHGEPDWLCKEHDKEKLMWAVLHTADISAQARPDPLFKKWSDRCYAEFFIQGDRERALGRPISPLMERSSTRIPQSQVGFIKFIVLPMFEALSITSNDLKEGPLECLRSNLKYWEELAKADVQSSLEAGCQQ